jgi:putative membrane protein
MLVVENIRLGRILRNTWQVDLIMIASCVAAYLSHKVLLQHHYEIPSIIPTVLGTAIAFFVGFNNNQAYDRWWEARKVWGALVNDSRSWARGILSYTSTHQSVNLELQIIRRRIIYRHIAFLYALKGALRNTQDSVYKTYLNDDEIKTVEAQSNIHNAILALQSAELQQLYANGQIDGYRFIQLDALLVKFTDSMGMSERIKSTIFPTTYSYFTKVFIWLFVVSIQLVISSSLGIWSIFISWLVGFVFVSTQINGMSLVNPFTNNPAAVPLNQITRTIEINLLEMLGDENIPNPVRPINDEYVL